MNEKDSGKGQKLDDRALMQRAVDLARQSVSEQGRISPRVGAVVARGGVLLGGAFRGELEPGEHAEFTLLEKKLGDEPLAGATLYTTLEPCTSRNAPKLPCVERIIERRIGKVFIGVLDPNENIRGSGGLRLREAGIDVALFDPELMAQIEELNREFFRIHAGAGRVERTVAQTIDPADPGEVGPNGHRVGYTEDGDKVEWVPDEQTPGEVWPLLLRRNDSQILENYNDLWDKIWWHRHEIRPRQIASGDKQGLPGITEETMQRAKQIEEKFGRKNLELDDFELGLVSGRMSALAWVLGSQWDDSLDT